MTAPEAASSAPTRSADREQHQRVARDGRGIAGREAEGGGDACGRDAGGADGAGGERRERQGDDQRRQRQEAQRRAPRRAAAPDRLRHGAQSASPGVRSDGIGSRPTEG
jgi:hypothetical protein